MTLNNETIQYQERLAQMVNDKQFIDSTKAHTWMNWKDWLVQIAYKDEIIMLRTSKCIGGQDDMEHHMTTAERARMFAELRGFFGFVYRTWDDRCANAFVGGHWHRVTEALSARSMFLQQKDIPQKLNKIPATMDTSWTTFCTVFGIAL
jgi:hypothetical protein